MSKYQKSWRNQALYEHRRKHIEELATKGLTSTIISKRTGAPLDTTRQTLRILVQKGKITRTKRGKGYIFTAVPA